MKDNTFKGLPGTRQIQESLKKYADIAKTTKIVITQFKSNIRAYT